ncbi:MAG: hypothetical protein ACOC8H_02020 [bacterium]
MLHHIRHWPAAIGQVHRVLRPGGVLAFEEALMGRSPLLGNRFWRHVPFGREELHAALCDAGFQVHRFEAVFAGAWCFVRVGKPDGALGSVCDGVITTGTMGNGQIEEHGLCVKTPQGWVLITGCAHPGIVHMTERATQIVESRLHLVVGGFHMGGASKQQIQAVIDRFEKLGVARVAPCHCSGNGTRRQFREHYGERYTPACVGTSLHFQAGDSGTTAR